MKTWFALLVSALSLSSGCATTGKSGECKTYRPVSMCSPGFEEKCQTTRDGCEQCGCVPIVDDSGRAPYEPR
ncbi:MAG TPA: hypothetical protein PK095_14725 [Myxococcota bacterium]|nr:hypothetical protein [Myxococcota bacterium]